jgi:uncharacterized protein
MSLRQDIDTAIKEAMKAKDKVRLETVRGIKKLILEREVEARVRGASELTPEEELAVVMQLAKQRRESIAQYEKGGRMDLVDQESQELKILETYLPQQLSEAEVSAILEEVVVQAGATSAQDFGKVMGLAMQRLKGQADGKVIQTLLKARLG